jgi:hypothetical protein
MSTLRETQVAFRDALLGQRTSVAMRDVCADGLAPAARMAIYRHHVAETLTDALKAVYPVVCRLVDGRFFAFAADHFIAEHPPTSPILLEYGAGFAEFLECFEPCRELGYLPDVARLEWAMRRAEHADDTTPLDARLLGDVTPDDLARVSVRFHPSATLLASPWPVDRIWRANQPGVAADTTVTLDGGPLTVQVWRQHDDVVLRVLAHADFAFRHALAGGAALATAAREALTIDGGFDLAAALAELFRDDILVAFSLTSDKEESS